MSGIERVVSSIWSLLLVAVLLVQILSIEGAKKPSRILVDTDVVADDVFALLYLLKFNRSQIDLQAVTISANAWTDAGHAVNHVYDLLYMMDRDDIVVGVGGEGGVLPNGTILSDVGGYLPIIEQGTSTYGGCRYRQAVPRGRLFTDTNYGIRRSFLPQGFRRYSPLSQPTAQQVMIDTISKGPTTVFIIGALTNLAIFLMSNPQLKKNIEHVYVMGGGVRSKNPIGCCPKDGNTSCTPAIQCGVPGNIFSGYSSNPYAEFNIFADPFAAYQVLHSGIPVTLVPLDATNTIPTDKNFFESIERNQHTYEAQYVLQSLKMVRGVWADDQFYVSYGMWDAFTSGVAASIMRNLSANGENEFSEMEFMNITVVTSNEPYGICDGSNPFFSGRATPMFNLQKDGVHSGHVQAGLRDPFCIRKNEKGKCQDGYTKEVSGPDGVSVLVATKAKPNQHTNDSLLDREFFVSFLEDGYTKEVSGPDGVRVLVATKAKPNRHLNDSLLDREFFVSFLEILNLPQHSGRFNFTTEFPYYKEVFYKPDFVKKKLGKPVVFDMDMSAGDFISLIYLLKVPVEVLNLKAILVSGTGWANVATIDIIYDILHMMGRDDIPVGLGAVFAMGQSNPSFSIVGDCKYVKAIPHGSGGLLDSDTLYGLSRDLPRSPRRYTAENSVKHGAPRNTDHPELRQPLALEVWQSISKSVDPPSKITILTNGPLTNLAQIILSEKNSSSVIENVYVVGGHLSYGTKDKGNLFSVPSNKYAEFNMFLDPTAAKTVLESELDITIIPLDVQRQICSFPKILRSLKLRKNTSEAVFTHRLLSRLYRLQQQHHRYQHMDTFLGEILGAVFLAGGQHLNSTCVIKPVKVLATGDLSTDGQIIIDEKHGKLVKIVERVNNQKYYAAFANLLGEKMQSAVIGSFDEQKKMWSTPTYKPVISDS